MSNTYAPGADLVPMGTYVATPTDAEDQCWRDTVVFVYQRTQWMVPSDVRLIWYRDPEDRGMYGQVIFGHPPVLLLLAGRRLADLRRTIVHELRHLWQNGYHLDRWTPAEREADAEAFVVQMMRRDR